jgi:hypothetical protein
MFLKFTHVVTLFLICVLCLLLNFPSPAIAGKYGGYEEGGSPTIAKNQNPSSGPGGSPGSIPNGVQQVRDMFKDLAGRVTRKDTEHKEISDRERRDTARDVTGEGHMPGGGPLER